MKNNSLRLPNFIYESDDNTLELTALFPLKNQNPAEVIATFNLTNNTQTKFEISAKVTREYDIGTSHQSLVDFITNENLPKEHPIYQQAEQAIKDYFLAKKDSIILKYRTKMQNNLKSNLNKKLKLEEKLQELNLEIVLATQKLNNFNKQNHS